MTLTLNFQGQIWNLLYLNQKWSDCHKTKSKHIDWTPGRDLWPHAWPWPRIFMVKFGSSRLTLNKVGGSRSFMTVTMVRCKDLPDSDRGDFRCLRAVDSSSFIWFSCCSLEGSLVRVAARCNDPGLNKLVDYLQTVEGLAQTLEVSRLEKVSTCTAGNSGEK